MCQLQNCICALLLLEQATDKWPLVSLVSLIDHIPLFCGLEMQLADSGYKDRASVLMQNIL
jgi:hypothetical protein